MDVAIHEGRLQRVLRYMEDGFVAARDAERDTPAAHTLTEDLLPTTCVVVNKLVGLTLSDNRASPARQKVFTADREIAAGGSPSPRRFTGSGHCDFDAREQGLISCDCRMLLFRDKRRGAGRHCGGFAVGVKTLQRAGAARLLQSFMGLRGSVWVQSGVFG